MMPKSTAPMERRFADLPRKKSIAKANNSARGMLIATINAVRTLLKNINKISTTRPTPTSKFSVTVSVVALVNSLRS